MISIMLNQSYLMLTFLIRPLFLSQVAIQLSSQDWVDPHLRSNPVRKIAKNFQESNSQLQVQ
jgi:hypothetical protein